MDAETLASALEEDIVFGVYAPGSRVVEDRILERFAVSRYVVRGAFAELEARGLVRNVPNRGAQVVELTPDDVDELYAIREILETSAARTTPLPAPSEVLDRLDAVRQRHEAAMEHSDFRAVFRLNIEFHAIQYSTCPNRRLREAITDYARRVHVIRAVKYGDRAHMDEVRRQHRDIVEALRGGDTDAYVRCVRAHLPASSAAYRAAYAIKHGGQRQRA